MADRWDYYEVTFSLTEHLNEDDALVIFNELDDDDRILGAAFSCGNDNDGHPFSVAAVEQAAQAMFAAQDNVSIERIRELLPIGLAALYARPADASPRQELTKEPTDG